MARFPSWIRKTMWRKMSAAEQGNALGAITAMLGANTFNSNMAMLRGIPADPVWVKFNPIGKDTGYDLRILERRVVRRLSRAQKEMAHRIKMAKLCKHNFVGAPGVATKACSLCGAVELA